jgi:GT2 family glycosyltransferase
VRALVEAGEPDRAVGTVCGKLLAMNEDFAIPDRPLFDSTGIFMTPNLRHLDRGSRMPDRGCFELPEYVFGATGAAALYRRSMISDVSVNGEFFDEDFFAYREDADVAWRAQLLGWKCLYNPRAVAYHVRSVLPENRHAISAVINMHSVKNRFLMRIKNATPGLYRRFGLSMTVRDVMVIAGCFLREWTSLRGLWFVLRHWRKTWRKRSQIMARRRISSDYILQWFSYEPVSFPAAVPKTEATVVR